MDARRVTTRNRRSGPWLRAIIAALVLTCSASPMQAAQTYGRQEPIDDARQLAIEMEASGTETLLADLRSNPGGHTLMGDILADRFRKEPEFFSEVTTGEYVGYSPPRNIMMVLVCPRTCSSGFSMLQELDLAGAMLIETPSTQSANTPGEGMIWSLDNTRIRGMVSQNKYVSSADAPERDRVWPVDAPSTYEYLASTGFDPNADLLLGRKWIEERERGVAE